MTPLVETRLTGEGTMRGWARVSVIVVVLCFMLNMLDGADLTIMSFVAKKMSAQWNVAPEMLGYIFSSSLAGMMIGCLFVAPLADSYGRRPMILFALALVTAAMMVSGYVTTVPQLLVARLVVGVGVGTIGVSMTAMAAEYAPPRYANFAVGFVQTGWQFAAIITAFAVAALLPHYNWQVTMIGIGAMSAVLLVITYFALPESMAFLVKRQPKGALIKLNALRARLGEAPLDVLPLPVIGARLDVSALFSGGRARTSILLWTAVTLGYFVLYFVNNWIPKLAAQAGLPDSQAIYAGASYSLGAFIGTAAISFLTVRYAINRAVAGFLGAGVIAMLVYGGVALPVVATLMMAAAVGVFMNGGFNGFWALSAALYPTEMRGTGIGWAMGLGRIGAVLGPIVGGYLVGAKLPISVIFGIYTVPVLIAAILCMMIKAQNYERELL